MRTSLIPINIFTATMLIFYGVKDKTKRLYNGIVNVPDYLEWINKTIDTPIFDGL